MARHGVRRALARLEFDQGPYLTESFIMSFCKSQFPHESVIFILELVDGFVGELTFAKIFYQHFL
jgi:hypothetical protein